MLRTIDCESESLYKSIQYVLNRRVFWCSREKKITLKAKSITSLSCLFLQLDEVQVVTLASQLYSQCLFLKERCQKAIIQFQPEHILFIDNMVFVYTNADDLYSLDPSTEKIIIDSPFMKTRYLAKELQAITVIPSSAASWSCLVESLGYVLLESFKYYEIDSPLKEFIDRCIRDRIFFYY